MADYSKREIRGDLFDISSRVKEIDPNYFLVFNLKSGRFEVHYRGQKNTFCLAVPYPILDARTVQLVLKTRVERRKELIAEMERENARKEKAELSGQIDASINKLEDLFR